MDIKREKIIQNATQRDRENMEDTIGNMNREWQNIMYQYNLSSTRAIMHYGEAVVEIMGKIFQNW